VIRNGKEKFFTLIDGFNNLHIGENNSIIAGAVEIHPTNIMVKLDTHDAANLVRLAMSNRKWLLQNHQEPI
jgi:DNA-binding NarL/FixJ family response regulator